MKVEDRFIFKHFMLYYQSFVDWAHLKIKWPSEYTIVICSKVEKAKMKVDGEREKKKVNYVKFSE